MYEHEWIWKSEKKMDKKVFEMKKWHKTKQKHKMNNYRMKTNLEKLTVKKSKDRKRQIMYSIHDV